MRCNVRKHTFWNVHPVKTKISLRICTVWSESSLSKGGGWARQRCCVSCVTGASICYLLTVGQGLLSLQQVRVEGECFHFFCFFTFIHFPLSPIPFFHLSSPFLWETTQNDPQGLTCRLTPTQSNSLSTRRNFAYLAIENAPNENSGQTAWMCRLIWIFAGCICLKVYFLTLCLIYMYMYEQQQNICLIMHSSR